MAPKKLKDVTLEDLEGLFETDGYKPQLAHGLAVAARTVHCRTREPDEFQISFDGRKAEFDVRKIRFLLAFLGEYDESSLAEEIYIEVISQLLGMSDWLFTPELALAGMYLASQYPLQLIDFLGQRPPFEGLRGKVKDFLRKISDVRLTAEGSVWWAKNCPALATLPWEPLVQALLCYQIFDRLGYISRNRIYAAIPPLFEAVVEQMGEVRRAEDPSKGPTKEVRRVWAMPLVFGGWRAIVDTSRVFRLVGSDTRALRLLIDLSQAYIDQHGTHYPTEELQ